MGNELVISRIELRRLLDSHREQLLCDIDRRIGHAVERALVDAGVRSSMISKAEAYRRFGRTAVDDWIARARVREVRDGTGKRIRLSLAQLAACAEQSNIRCRR